MDTILYQWRCTCCGKVLKNAGDEVESSHEDAPETPTCCDKDMVWEKTDDYCMVERVLDAVFDFAHQCYRTWDGKKLEDKEDWDFPCDRCNGPARLDHVSASGEWHTCLNCDHDILVN